MCGGLLRQLAVENEKMKEYKDSKHYTATKKIVANSQKCEKEAFFICHHIEIYSRK